LVCQQGILVYLLLDKLSLAKAGIDLLEKYDVDAAVERNNVNELYNLATGNPIGAGSEDAFTLICRTIEDPNDDLIERVDGMVLRDFEKTLFGLVKSGQETGTTSCK
jgi:hypothetical protein